MASHDIKGEEDALEVNNQIQLHKELFWTYTSPKRILYVSTDIIDFKFVENGKTSSSFTLTVTNTSNEKIRLKWCSNTGTVENGDETNFNVQPEETFINKMTSLDFKVTFKPNKNEAYFFSNLTLIGMLKTDYKKQMKLLNKKIGDDG